MIERFWQRFAFLMILTVQVLSSFSQNKPENETHIFVEGQISETKYFPDTSLLNVYLTDRLNDDHSDGYMHAGVDSIVLSDSVTQVYYYKGNLFQWGEIRLFGFPDERGFKYEIASLKRKHPSAKRIERFLENVNEEAMSLGYAKSVSVISDFSIESNIVSFDVIVEHGELFKLDSLYIDSDLKFPLEYLYYKSGVFPGDVFNVIEIEKIANGVYDPVFLKQSKVPELQFADDEFQISLHYKKNKRNSLRGVVGIVPGNAEENLYLTGEANIHFFNAFYQAEEIDFFWRAFEPESQQLNLNYLHPVLLGPWGVVSGFSLLKQDSSYINLNYKVGLHRLMRSSDFEFYIEKFKSSVVEQNGTDDTVYSAEHQKFGLSYKRVVFDNVDNPTKGYLIKSDFLAGLRKVGESDDNTTISEAGLQINLFCPLSRRVSFAIKSNTGYKYSSKSLYQRELFRIGGMNSIRGYSEQSVFAKQFSLLSLEGLFFPDKESALFIFCDGGIFLTDRLKALSSENVLFGIGSGIKVNTGAGKLVVSFALPMSDEALVDFRKSKIHVGYLNNF